MDHKEMGATAKIKAVSESRAGSSACSKQIWSLGSWLGWESEEGETCLKRPPCYWQTMSLEVHIVLLKTGIRQEKQNGERNNYFSYVDAEEVSFQQEIQV